MAFKEFLSSNYKENEHIAKMYIKPDGGAKTYCCTAGHLVNADYQNEVNAYMLYNTIYFKNGAINRDKEHVSRLKWNYIDLDIYHSKDYKDLTQEQVLWILEQDYFGHVLPAPTYIINSGRGMYLLWKIDEHINALPRWNRVQKYFYEVLKDFGADSQTVTDTARVFRVLGSINSKSNTKVEIMKHNEVKYCLSNIIREYLPPDKPTGKMIDYAEGISRILGVKAPDMKDRNAVRSFIGTYKEMASAVYQLNKAKKSDRKKVFNKSKIYQYGTEYSLLKARLSDLETLLLQHRDNEGGHRETILFLYRYWNLCINEDKHESLHKTLELNRRLLHSLSEREVICATRSAEKYYDKDKCFLVNNRQIISLLKITVEEMKDMKTIISKEICRDRKRERNRKAYLDRLKKQGKNTKAEQKKDRLKAINKLLQQGKTQPEICNILNISKSTFFNDKKELECVSDTQISEQTQAEVVGFTDIFNSPKNSAFVHYRPLGLAFCPDLDDAYSLPWWSESG